MRKHPHKEPESVAPRVGAWIETQPTTCNNASCISSHPVWVRGLKLAQIGYGRNAIVVAPRVGAWIETVIKSLQRPRLIRRTPCGCVD